ncbi:MAG: FAD-dependent oxidoreductase [Brooklawnia sp.]|uniref:FAD-dependent oxidoreductase n=1 Tax=Brooklawnia sp. TaxID=2699740 RepID=UPI003C789ACB
MGNRLNQEQRRRDLTTLASDDFDIVVIGGGVTGAGVALDAASRGLRTAVVEAQDWGSGASSRSTRLVMGGLRYLYLLDIGLVADSIRERGRLVSHLAPHLVKPQAFLWPLPDRCSERWKAAAAINTYDAHRHHRQAGPAPAPAAGPGRGAPAEPRPSSRCLRHRGGIP